MRLTAGPILFALATTSPAPAWACNIDDSVEIISGELHSRGAVGGVALVAVTRVAFAPTDASLKGFEKFNWDASYKLKRLISGDVAVSRLVRRQRTGPGSCDLPFAGPPKVGDLRVLYVFDGGGSYDVTPEAAKLYDPKLRGVLPRW